jgi:hypothetical protein
MQEVLNFSKRMIIIFLKIILKRVDNTKLMNDYNFSKRMIIIFVKKLLDFIFWFCGFTQVSDESTLD